MRKSSSNIGIILGSEKLVSSSQNPGLLTGIDRINIHSQLSYTKLCPTVQGHILVSKINDLETRDLG